MQKRSKIAFLFPGQGAQFVGMGKDIYEKYPTAKAIFDAADEILGFSLSALCFAGPEAELTLTANTQPAILTHSYALLRLFEEMSDIRPHYVAGHSLGEYSALLSAGALKFEDALRTVHQRGKFMQEAVPVGKGSMAAIMAMDFEKLQKLCEEITEPENLVHIANRNCPGQYVVSGHSAALQSLMQRAKESGALVIPLAVSAPFHSPLMRNAAEALKNWFRNITFSDISIPLINNADAKILQDAAEIRDSLIRQLTAPVLWEDSMRTLIAEGVQTFVEIGPGKVLSGLMKRIDRNVNILNIRDEESLQNSRARLQELYSSGVDS